MRYFSKVTEIGDPAEANELPGVNYKCAVEK
jgi:hypothetical protein